MSSAWKKSSAYSDCWFSKYPAQYSVRNSSSLNSWACCWASCFTWSRNGVGHAPAGQ